MGALLKLAPCKNNRSAVFINLLPDGSAGLPAPLQGICGAEHFSSFSFSCLWQTPPARQRGRREVEFKTRSGPVPCLNWRGS